jgi:hypothetical protein
MARSGELDNVPALIYALSDPCGAVVIAARDGLQFISRKIQGYGPQVKDGKLPGKDEIKQVQDKWKQWYLSIRPDGKEDFLE